MISKIKSRSTTHSIGDLGALPRRLVGIVLECECVPHRELEEEEEEEEEEERVLRSVYLSDVLPWAMISCRWEGEKYYGVRIGGGCELVLRDVIAGARF